MTDLTLLARGGPMWSCGYDDHELPPVRGRGNQGIRTASHFAVMSILTALLARSRHGGQFIDLSMHAAVNVTLNSPAMDGWRPSRPCSVRPAVMPRPSRANRRRSAAPTVDT